MACAAFGALAAEPGGQDAGKEKEEEFDPRVYLEQDDDAAGLIRAAWRARETGNWRLAIDKYLEAARKYGNTVFPHSDRLYLPVRALIHKELSELPREGRDLYRLIKGREAEQAYLLAAALGDRRGLERVAEDFPGLDAAPRALFLLGEMARARGEQGRAVFFWRRLLADYPEWQGGSRPGLLARAALVSVESGRQAEAAEVLGQLKLVAGLSKLRLGGSEVLVVDEIEKRVAASSGAHVAGGGGAREGWWPTIGGDSSHAGTVPHQVDAGVCRWQKKLAKVAFANEQMLRNSGISRDSFPSKIGPRHPVAAGGMVLLAGDTDVAAYRAMSGNLVWKAPAGSAREELPASRQTLPALGEGRVYVCLGQPSATARNMWQVRAQQTSSSVVMRSFGVESGKLVWESGRGEDKATAEFLKSVDLVAVPVYAGGYVYCPAVKRGSLNDVYMLCFEADTGRLAWKSFLCAAQPLCGGQNYMQIQVAEDCPPPAVGEGLVGVATNAGALAVLDAGSGQLVWIYLYDRLEASTKAGQFGRSTTTIPETWASCPPIISGGMIFAAPQDCGEILAMELATGRIKWKARRGDMEHLVGISNGRLVLSGGKEVVALSAANGKRLWSSSLAAEESGLGLVGDDFVVIPTKSALQRFDLASGAAKASYLFKQGDAESGNLVISGDVLVSSGAEALAGYYAWDQIVGKLRKEIAGSPDAAGPRAELAEVYFSAEKYPEAVELFLQALERVKPGENRSGVSLETAVKQQVWEAHSRMGRAAARKGDFAQALKSYQLAHRYRAGGNDEMIGHMRFAECREKLGEFAEAAGEYQTVLARLPEEIYSRPGAGEVQAGRFAQTQIDRLIKEHGREVYARFDAEAGGLLGRARDEKNPAMAQRVIREYPNSQSVSPALVLLSELHMAAGKAADAAGALREHLWKCLGSEREAEVRARLAMAYRAQGLEPLCRGMLTRMARSLPERTFELEGRQWSVKEFVAARLPGGSGPVVNAGPTLPDLSPPVVTIWKGNLGAALTALVPADSEQGGPEGLVVCSAREGRGGYMIAALNAANGKLMWKDSLGIQPNRGGTFRALALPGTVVSCSGGKVRALAATSGKLIWERDLLDRQEAGVLPQGNDMLAAGDGLVVAASQVTTFDPRTRARTTQCSIMALDEGAGQQVWKVEESAGVVYQIETAEGLLLVGTQDPTRGGRQVVAYDLADGRKRFAASVNGWGGPFIVQNEFLLIPSQASLDCYELSTGKLKWRGQSKAGSMTVISAVDDERVVSVERQARNGRSQVVAWDLATGKKRWASEEFAGNVASSAATSGLPGAPAGSTARVAVNVYDTRTRRMTVTVFDGASGKIVWRSDLPQNTHVMNMAMGSKHLAAVVRQPDGKSGLRIWALDTGKLSESRGLDEAGKLGLEQGAVLFLGSQCSGERLGQKVEEKGSAPGGGR